jgi:hypothetical protein
MSTYVYRDGKLVDKRYAPPKEAKHGTASFVISDEMAPTRHMADGQHYTSKAKFRQATRAAGCVEVGTETATLLKPRQQVELDQGKRRDDIRKAIYDLRNR